MSTTIFDVPMQIARDMEGTGFPPHPVTNVAPTVNPADYPDAAESIVIVSRTSDDDTVTEWASMGSLGKHETYIVDIVVTTQVAGVVWVDMMTRLAELTVAVLDVYTDDNGQFVPPGGVDAENENPYRIFRGMATAERSNQWGTDEGWCGQCRVAIRIAARI
jgi:hypothetical protein